MMKSAKLEWQLNNTKKAAALLLEAVEKHPEFAKVGTGCFCVDHVTVRIMSHDVM